MKKFLLFLAANAAVNMACAQSSSVTVFGVIDAALSHGSGSVSKRTSMANEGIATNRLGFRGVEDLGSGLRAGFWLEAGFLADTGAGAATNTNNQLTGINPANIGFNRRATVSMFGPFGEVRVGRDFATTFWNNAIIDPFEALGVGATQTQAATIGGLPTNYIRVSNAISYFTPGCSGPVCQGFYGQLQGYLGENPRGLPTSSDGNGSGLRVGYGNQDFNGALTAATTKFASGDITSLSLAGRYDLKVVKLAAILSRDKVDSPVAVTGKSWLLGLIAPVGNGEIRTAYSTYERDTAGTPRASKFALGYVHSLSKRTALYATGAYLKNSGGSSQALGGSVTAPNASSKGVDLGIRHFF